MTDWLSREIGERGSGTRDWAIDAETCLPLRACGILVAGCTSLGAGYRYVRLSPLFAHVGACLEGEVDYLIEGQWTRARAGTVLVAPAGVPHGSQSISSRRAGRGRIAWVHFAPLAHRTGHRPGWDSGPARLICNGEVRPLWWALQALYVEASVPPERMDPAVLAQWAELVTGCATRLAESDPAVHDPTRAVWEAVDMNLRHPWSGEELAALAGMSETHFRRVCHACLGSSPSRHLAKLRMRRARMLLTLTGDKLSSIANTVGYTDVFAFSVAFKRYSGASPSAYRAASKSTHLRAAPTPPAA